MKIEFINMDFLHKNKYLIVSELHIIFYFYFLIFIKCIFLQRKTEKQSLTYTSHQISFKM